MVRRVGDQVRLTEVGTVESVVGGGSGALVGGGGRIW